MGSRCDGEADAGEPDHTGVAEGVRDESGPEPLPEPNTLHVPHNTR